MNTLDTAAPEDQKMHTSKQKLSFALVKLLYHQGKGAILGSLLTGFCIVLGLYHVIPKTILFNWFLSLLVISVLRYVLVTAYLYAKPPIEKTSLWEALFIITTMCSGLMWMAAGTILLPEATIYQTLIAFGIAGIVAGSVPFFAPSKIASLSFILLVLLPFGIKMFLQDDTPHQLVGFLSVIYLVALVLVSLRIHKEICATLKLKFENDELIHRLYAAKNEVEQINKELQLEVHERIEVENLLRNSEEQYRLVTNALPVLIAYIDTELYFRFNNQAYEEWFKKSLDKITGQSVKSVFGEAGYSAFLEHYQKLLTGNQVHYETTMFFHEEQERYVSVTLIPHIREKNVCGVFSLISDMTPRINYLATHDALTTLPNRSLFNARLVHALKHAYRNKTQVALLFLDLDHFKNINDTLGHDIGDQLLVKVGERIKSCIQETDTLARLGGDEFIIILPDVIDMQRVVVTAKELCQALSNVFRINDRDLFITTSVGISVYPDDGEDMQVLLRNADMAMYRAKDRGRNTYEFYTQGMNEAIQRKIKIETNLRGVLERRDLKIHYQPVMDLKQNKITSIEALLRWNHPDMGLIPSGEFIAIAEETGLIVPIGEWVLRTACKQNYLWQQAGYEPVRVTVNLSPRQFMKRNLAEVIATILNETGLPGKYLTLEITESSVMRDVEYAIKVIKELKALDILISIDDFGTGYSSLSHLKRLPFDILKIDRSFITDFALNPEDAAIVKAIIAMGHNLKMKVIAEGVEQPEQFLFLKDHGCDEIQGYLFYPPLPEAEIEVVLQTGMMNLTLENRG